MAFIAPLILLGIPCSALPTEHEHAVRGTYSPSLPFESLKETPTNKAS
jgi:hypothetical protein